MGKRGTRGIRGRLTICRCYVSRVKLLSLFHKNTGLFHSCMNMSEVFLN